MLLTTHSRSVSQSVSREFRYQHQTDSCSTTVVSTAKVCDRRRQKTTADEEENLLEITSLVVVFRVFQLLRRRFT